MQKLKQLRLGIVRLKFQSAVSLKCRQQSRDHHREPLAAHLIRGFTERHQRSLVVAPYLRLRSRTAGTSPGVTVSCRRSARTARFRCQPVVAHSSSRMRPFLRPLGRSAQSPPTLPRDCGVSQDVSGTRRLCRPSQVVLDILQLPQKGPFRKEDGELVLGASGILVH